MSDYYELTNANSNFKSRLNDVFDKLTNLEKQHDVNIKTNSPIAAPDDEVPSSSSSTQNPSIPSHAITFKKRPADDTFARPEGKWKKYDLDDVNEHHLSSMGNQYALNDYLRTRAKPSITKETEEDTSLKPVFKRPLKKQTLTTEDDDDNTFIPIRAPIPSNTNETKTENNDDEKIEYKLKSIRKPTRGVFSRNEKKSNKASTELSKQNEDDGEKDYKNEKRESEGNDDDNEDVDDEFFEP